MDNKSRRDIRIAKSMWKIIEREFADRSQSFTPSDVQKLYHQQRKETIELATVKLHLSKYLEDGRLIAAHDGKRGKPIYKIYAAPSKLMIENVNRIFDTGPIPRTKVLKLLREIKRAHPDQRYGQILWNALSMDGHWVAPHANELYYIHDEIIEKALENYHKDVLRKVRH